MKLPLGYFKIGRVLIFSIPIRPTSWLRFLRGDFLTTIIGLRIIYDVYFDQYRDFWKRHEFVSINFLIFRFSYLREKFSNDRRIKITDFRFDITVLKEDYEG